MCVHACTHIHTNTHIRAQNTHTYAGLGKRHSRLTDWQQLRLCGCACLLENITKSDSKHETQEKTAFSSWRKINSFGAGWKPLRAGVASGGAWLIWGSRQGLPAIYVVPWGLGVTSSPKAGLGRRSDPSADEKGAGPRTG